MSCKRVLKRKMMLLRGLTRLRSNPCFQNSKSFQGSRIVRLQDRVGEGLEREDVQERVHQYLVCLIFSDVRVV